LTTCVRDVQFADDACGLLDLASSTPTTIVAFAV
jgi:hypothetical protein